MTTLTTGKDGKATAKNLPLGQYRVVEVEAPYGYVLNTNGQKVTFTYVDDKTPVIKESLTFSDDRQKLDMSVTKLDAEDMDCQHFFRQIFLGYFPDIVQAFDTLGRNVYGDDYTSLHNPIVLSSVLLVYGMFHSTQILF